MWLHRTYYALWNLLGDPTWKQLHHIQVEDASFTSHLKELFFFKVPTIHNHKSLLLNVAQRTDVFCLSFYLKLGSMQFSFERLRTFWLGWDKSVIIGTENSFNHYRNNESLVSLQDLKGDIWVGESQVLLQLNSTNGNHYYKERRLVYLIFSN